MKRSLAAVALCWWLSLPASAEEPKFAYIDLEAKITQKLADKFGNDNREGNFLTVPKGEQTFEKIKFKIGEGVIQLGSKVLTEQPDMVKGIKVDKKLAKLHVLHATGYGGGPNAPGTAWHVEDDTPIGAYKIHYEDKSVETIPIIYGQDVRDWWFREDEKDTSRSKVAWKGENDLANKYGCKLRLYLTTWENPKPDKKIVSIDYIGRKDETVAAPFCVALTLEEK
jgi:hypothetical protein